MSAEIGVLKLACSSCGANLEIASLMEAFACGYCGSQQVVQRRGGTVSLKSVTEAIAKVQAGTDKMASELAIQRLQKEKDGLVMRRGQALQEVATMSHGHDSAVGRLILGLGFLDLLIAGAVAGADYVVLAHRKQARSTPGPSAIGTAPANEPGSMPTLPGADTPPGDGLPLLQETRAPLTARDHLLELVE